MAQRNPLYDFGDEGEGEAPTFNEKWGNLPVEAPRFNLTPNVALVESEPKPLKQNTDPVTGRPDLKFVPVDDPWANTPKPIKRLLGVGGEERYQLWPERTLRSGLSVPLDALTGKMQVNDPETGMPTDEAIRRSQDVASVGGPGGLMNLREEGILGSHGGKLKNRGPNQERLAINDIVSKYKDKGVTLDASYDGVGPYNLHWIESKGLEPKAGTKAIRELSELADKNKKEIQLVAMADEQEGGQYLPKYYKSLGFKPTGEMTPDGPVMIRKPNAKIDDIMASKLLSDTSKPGMAMSSNYNFIPVEGNPHEQVDNSHHVPYGAGASNTSTGFPVNIDKRIPKYDDKLKLPNGQPADLHKYLTIHEIEEYKAMKAGIPYHKAHHEIATPMEKKAVESDGVSWKEYEHIMDGYLKETEEGGYKNLPKSLYLKPYPHSRSLKMDHGESE